MKLIRKTRAEPTVKRRAPVFLMFLTWWLFSLPIAVTFAQPDIRGTYTGAGTETLENCQDPADNITFDFSVSVSIPDQVEGAFSGSATVTAVIGEINIETSLAGFSGTVTAEGELSGAFTYTTLVNGEFDSSGDGIFTGQVAGGDMLEVNFSGQDQVGDTCTFTGSFSVTRESTLTFPAFPRTRDRTR